LKIYRARADTIKKDDAQMHYQVVTGSDTINKAIMLRSNRDSNVTFLELLDFCSAHSWSLII